MTRIKFSPQVLSSRENLVNFFEVNKAADKKLILNPPGKWERVTQYIKDSCLHYCRAYTPHLIHKFTQRDIICETDWNKDSVARTSLYEELIYPFERNDVLVRTGNYQRADTDDIYMQKPFPLSGIRDQRVRKCINFICRTSPNELKYLEFTNEGYCLGISLWFAVHFFETRKNFPNTLQGQKEHFIAVANLFARGAPRAATLLQAFQKKFDDLDFFNVRESFNKSFYYKRTPVIGNRIENIEQLAKQIKNMKPGLYLLELPEHAVIFEKLDDERALLFDPDKGAVWIQGPRGEKKMIAFVLQTMRQRPFKSFAARFFLHHIVLEYIKLVPANERYWLEKVKKDLLVPVYVYSFPLRVCYFWIIDQMKAVYAGSIRRPSTAPNPILDIFSQKVAWATNRSLKATENTRMLWNGFLRYAAAAVLCQGLNMLCHWRATNLGCSALSSPPMQCSYLLPLAEAFQVGALACGFLGLKKICDFFDSQVEVVVEEFLKKRAIDAYNAAKSQWS